MKNKKVVIIISAIVALLAIVGTVLIRTSDELTASKQKALEEKVINALAELK